ncbi:hypothetical protein GCK72_023882 [Caenorhabditis remanei]|uniref:Uncharacterized protein n=1 Tax=Caenorhabditis remanei TaxID=31234 RepID=E3M2H4_CAERE|nr:hypothetical protein GCK72_023882 [Caenorhabditis remanei]EFO89908.1 hypothetical protein CRE_07362 [Caenorhabditis remanei]KAF1747420.1 hypothetical protein GCK72_023882 [Caenorhabditis remanei]
MSQEATVSDSNVQNRYKSVMNIFRRAFNFRKKGTKQDVEENTPLEIEMQPIAKPPTPPKPRAKSSPSTSNVPSTSAASTQPRRRGLYEDPFVAVLTDGTIYVKNYYNFNELAEYQMSEFRYAYVKRNSCVIEAKDIDRVYYTPGATYKDSTVCKNWGICMNDVWWASHIDRLEDSNPHTTVVLYGRFGLHAGLSVVNIDAFAESLQCVGLPRDAPFQSGLPNPPLKSIPLPYIDDDVEEEVPRVQTTSKNLIETPILQ